METRAIVDQYHAHLFGFLQHAHKEFDNDVRETESGQRVDDVCRVCNAAIEELKTIAISKNMNKIPPRFLHKLI